METDLLIIGGGPTGLAAACEAKRHGLSVRIVERLPTRATMSKAFVEGAKVVVRPDRIVAKPDLLPSALAVPVEAS